jgi:hypothetical protein
MLFAWVGDQKRTPIAKGERPTATAAVARSVSFLKRRMERAVAGDLQGLVASVLQAMTHAVGQQLIGL